MSVKYTFNVDCRKDKAVYVTCYETGDLWVAWESEYDADPALFQAKKIQEIDERPPVLTQDQRREYMKGKPLEPARIMTKAEADQIVAASAVKP